MELHSANAYLEKRRGATSYDRQIDQGWGRGHIDISDVQLNPLELRTSFLAAYATYYIPLPL